MADAPAAAPPAATRLHTDNLPDAHRLRLGWLPNLRHDAPASLVVFLVALPLCLGIALASGAPLFSGILAGIAGGIVVGLLSGSHTSVSGPAAGLTVIVAGALASLGSFELFLAAVVGAGLLQIGLSFLSAGVLADYVPAGVIKGMMAAIGIVIILKQIPHALGRDTDYEGDLAFINPGDGLNTFEEIFISVLNANPGALLITTLSLLVLILWEMPRIKRAWLGKVPGALLVVVLGIVLNTWLATAAPGWHLQTTHRVNLPVAETLGQWLGFLTFPDWTGLLRLDVWTSAATIALVASLESLLALEATDKLDPFRRLSDKSRELRAQGLGNLTSGLIGGIPVTSVVVRSSANVFSGARTRASAVYHGVLLLGTALLIPRLLNAIPLASLACILILLGYKLAAVSIFKAMYRSGWRHFLPFAVTVLAIVFTDLLTGVVIGIVLGLFFVIRTNQRHTFTMVNDGQDYLLRFNKDATFVNRAELKARLAEVPDDARLVINAAKARTIDADIHEVLNDFAQNSAHRNIQLEYQHYERVATASAH